MKDNFLPSLKLVLASEGGNDDDPLDHGGRTSRGVTQREYNAWRSLRGLEIRDVWEASDQEIAAIYREDYWNPVGDSFPKGIDYLYFDMAINAGPYRAAVLLQRALGVTDDGRIGPITKMAVARANPDKLVHDYTGAKAAFYRGIVANNPSQKRFIKGWINRALRVEKDALKMVG